MHRHATVYTGYVARLQGVKPSDARRFRTGRPSLDFAHTGGDGPLAAFELLVDADAVARWLGVVLHVDGIEVDAGHHDDVIELRRAIWRAAHHIMAGRPVGHRERRVINEAAAHAPVVPELASNGDAGIAGPVTVDQALSELARDAIDLFGGPLASQIRTCAAPDCALLFVDQSRPGTRRWCSMQRCGNLTKVRRHRGNRIRTG
jgi:predicted RNA-binding Zn ribbon-like protein